MSILVSVPILTAAVSVFVSVSVTFLVSFFVLLSPISEKMSYGEVTGLG